MKFAALSPRRRVKTMRYTSFADMGTVRYLVHHGSGSRAGFRLAHVCGDFLIGQNFLHDQFSCATLAISAMDGVLNLGHVNVGQEGHD